VPICYFKEYLSGIRNEVVNKLVISREGSAATYLRWDGKIKQLIDDLQATVSNKSAKKSYNWTVLLKLSLKMNCHLFFSETPCIRATYAISQTP